LVSKAQAAAHQLLCPWLGNSWLRQLFDDLVAA